MAMMWSYFRSLTCARNTLQKFASPAPPACRSYRTYHPKGRHTSLGEHCRSLSAVEAAMAIAPGGCMMKKLWFDVDCGVDDAQAMMLAFAVPNINILGISCVHGNTPLDNVCKNTLRVLSVCKKLEIPVYRGAEGSLLGLNLNAGGYHGKDGLGDAPDPNAPGLELLQKEGAVEAMIRTANEHPGQVTFVATAPVTNLALAARLDPTFPEKIKELYIMGGNTESRGNTTVCAEFNFIADPEAAFIVLNTYKCPTYIAAWEFTCRNKLPWSFCERWLAQDSDKARFMKKISQHTLGVITSDRYQKELVDGLGFASCDSYATAAAIDNSIVTCEEVAATVELNGKHTRGMMVLDTLELLGKDHKVFIMKDMDLKKFEKMMMDALK